MTELLTFAAQALFACGLLIVCWGVVLAIRGLLGGLR